VEEQVENLHREHQLIRARLNMPWEEVSDGERTRHRLWQVCAHTSGTTNDEEDSIEGVAGRTTRKM
jgi:hypothetical protein